MLSRRDVLAVPFASLATSGIGPLGFAFADDPDPTKVYAGGFNGLEPIKERQRVARTLNDEFLFIVPKSKEAWEARRKQLRQQLLVATGLWPLPEKTPLNPVVHGAIDKGEYTVEKVYFASTPGHYVCGNLYRPKGGTGKRPGVLFAHGHWAEGRFHDAGEKAGAASVAGGGEPDLDRGRYFMQALPATLAGLGFVVFQYDMVGYADSTAIPHGKGFADAEAELRLQSAMGLQTWNSIRALDFLASLGDVDAKKLGMTGASGGGTQTFMLAALDDRLSCAFPAVMVSTGMQGGCVCENCSLLRVGTGNVEIAALFAPKPMAFSCANDWTKDFVRKGYPELEQVYKLYGAEHRVDAKEWLKYGHQYNVHAREFMYFWMRSHLMAKEERATEAAFKPVVPPTDLSVFDEKHPRPKDELDAKGLQAALAKASDEQMTKLAPKDAASLKEFQRVVGTALRAMVQPDRPHGKEGMLASKPGRAHQKLPGGLMGAASEALWWTAEQSPGDGKPQHGTRERIPFFKLYDAEGKYKIRVVWLHPLGKKSVWEKGKPTPAAQALIDANCCIDAIDVMGTGEASEPVAVDKQFAGYTYGYNPSLLAHRVRDAIKLINLSKEYPDDRPVHLVGWDGFGVVAILAKALAGDAVTKTAADLNQFRFEDIKDAADPMMLPGAVKYGGLGAFLALCAPGEVLVHNQMGTGTGQLSRAAYDAAGAANKLTRNAAKLDPVKVAEWLVK